MNEPQREARQATFLSRRGLKVASLFIPVPLLSEPRVLTRANLSGGSFLCALGYMLAFKSTSVLILILTSAVPGAVPGQV